MGNVAAYGAYGARELGGGGPGAVDGGGRGLPGDAVRRLAQRWLPLLARPGHGAGAGGDFVCSPVGLWLALASVAAGARGETAAELRELLGVAGADAARAVTEGTRALAATDALGVATQVWSRVPVHRACREALPGIGFGALDAADPRAVEAMDAWVRAATGGLVERLPVEVTPDVLLLLVNVLVLKAGWATPFEGAATRDADFTDAAGVRHRVPTMHRAVAPGDAWTVDGVARVVELGCREEAGRAPVRVRFVLGPPGAGPAEVLPLAWAPGERCARLDAEQVALALPRFALRSRIDVTEQLAALGVRRSLGGAADFSGISPERLAISQVVQEAVVTVAERGVEAAAVTAVPMAPGAAVSRPLRVERVAFERPFGVVVLDGVGVPLFAGWQAGVPVGA